MLHLIVLAGVIAVAPEERVLFDYFLDYRTPSGLVLDGTHDPDTVSVAATGFAMDCWAIAVHKGLLERDLAIQYIRQALDATIAANQGNRGWLYHFTDTQGRPKFDGEVSSIDSAIFYLGARQAAKRLHDPELIDEVERLIAAVDLGWMLENGYDPKYRGKRYFSHGFYWKETTDADGQSVRLPEFIAWDWKEYSEGVMLYRLFDIAYEPADIPSNLPLFTYFYPLCFFDDPAFVERLRNAAEFQRQQFGVIGKTACMGPSGYAIMEEHIVSPLAVWSCVPYVPAASEMLDSLQVPRYAPWYHVQNRQVGTGILGIDAGSCLILLNKDVGMAENIARFPSLEPASAAE